MSSGWICRHLRHRWTYPFVVQLRSRRYVVRMCKRCPAARVTEQDVWSPRERAKRLGYVPSEPVDQEWADRVRELARAGGGAS